MKKSSLTTAVLAGLAGLVGFAGSSQAVEINADGTGQVLIYPYYTVNAGQQTSISVVNSTDAGKAVKVRFIEGYNSREVLDFNLFLSKYDVWTGTIFSMADAGLAGDGAAFGTSDSSCTVPTFASLPTVGNGLHYQPFSDLAYAGSATDTGPTGLDRTREGYVEMISMADVMGASLAAITHVQPVGVPPTCGAASLRSDGGDFIAPTGGLFGAGFIINVAEGTLYPYVADAIDGFTDVKAFTQSGSLSPNLNFADTSNTSGPGTARAYVFEKGGAVVTATYGGGRTVDAVSAVFAAKSLLNEWVANADAGQGTDWVVTFPTKRFYVDPAIVATAQAPFVERFGDNQAGQSCVQVGINKYNREEGTPLITTDDDFSPPPPGQPPSSLCHEVNLISISNSADPVSILGSPYVSSTGAGLALNISPYGTAGWMRLDLDPVPGTEPHAMTPSFEGVVFNGLPATGFAAQRYINANAAPGTLANYAGAFRHRVQRETSTVLQ